METRNSRKQKVKALPVVFRIPEPILARLDIVASNKFLSCNKLVSMILDEDLPKNPILREELVDRKE